MRFKTLSAVLVALAATSALAETPTVVKDDFVSTRSRAEVQAELFAYQKAGVNPWSRSYNPLAGFRSATSRDQVIAEYIASRDEVAATHGEDSGSAYFAQAHRNGAATTLAGTPVSAQ